MKLFDRTPTGRPRRGRSYRSSYSKTDKPLLHKIKRILTNKKSKYMMICSLIICFIFLLYTVISPSSSIPNEGNIITNSTISNIEKLKNNNNHQKADKLIHKFNSNPGNLDHLEELLEHRNHLEKTLKNIDNLLLENKDKLSDFMHLMNPDLDRETNKKRRSRLKEKFKNKKSEKIRVENDQKIQTKNNNLTDVSTDDNTLNPSVVRAEIITEFKFAWNVYKKCAWGFDTLHPISCTGTNDAFDLGLAMIDALDTLIIMNINNNDNEITDDINNIKEWITNNMRFDRKTEVSLFESTIRVLGGLLSAYSLTNDSIYLSRAEELGNKLLPAFDTATGIPYASVNFVTNKGFNPGWSKSATSTSEAASIQLEFNYLSYLTNNNIYYKKARNSQNMIIKAQKSSNPPLLRKFINIKSGKFNDNKISFGSRIDSTYEYYLKVPLALSRHPSTDPIFEMYLDSISTAERVLFQRTAANNRLYIAEKSGNSISDQFDHLVCFIGGSLAMGSLHIDDEALSAKHFNYGRELTDTCASIYASTPTGLAPEIVYFSRTDKKNDFNIHSNDKHNLLRPETVESIFYLWRITHKQKYRDIGYKIFDSFRKYTKMESNKWNGYGSINDVTVQSKESITFRGDKMESFFLAETLKYLYLLFCDDDVININKYVFNTEAHLIPVLTSKEADKIFK